MAMQFWFGLTGYLAAAAVSAVLIALLLNSSSSSKQATRLALALAVSFLWASATVIVFWRQGAAALPQ
jgi:hypothetical protein